MYNVFIDLVNNNYYIVIILVNREYMFLSIFLNELNICSNTLILLILALMSVRNHDIYMGRIFR